MHQIRSLSDSADFRAAFAREYTRTMHQVCEVCGLAALGHAPESEWLGYEKHPFTGVTATPEQLEEAHRLTSRAYRAREVQRRRDARRAPVTPDAYSRQFAMSMPDDTMCGVFDGDLVARYRHPSTPIQYRYRDLPGQLWERLHTAGEGLANLPLYTARIANAFRRVTTKED